MASAERKRTSEKSKNSQGKIVETHTEKIFIGPLPSAEELEAYEKISPGTAKILIDNMVKQSNHRMGLEKAFMVLQGTLATRGQMLAAFVAAINTIFGSIVQIYKPQNNYDGILQICIGFVVFAGLYIYNDIQKRKELERKKEVMKE